MEAAIMSAIECSFALCLWVLMGAVHVSALVSDN
jgi:hypothetical protein